MLWHATGVWCLQIRFREKMTTNKYTADVPCRTLTFDAWCFLSVNQLHVNKLINSAAQCTKDIHHWSSSTSGDDTILNIELQLIKYDIKILEFSLDTGRSPTPQPCLRRPSMRRHNECCLAGQVWWIGYWKLSSDASIYLIVNTVVPPPKQCTWHLW